MKFSLLGVMLLALNVACLPGWATDETAASPAPFAIIPPHVVAALKDQASTPEGQAIIKLAKTGLSATPHPLPRIHLEGTLPHQGIWDQSLLAVKDLPLMQDFGFAYRLTGDRRFLDAEERYLSAWLDIYKVSLNPIDETSMDQFIVAYDLTSPDLSAATKEKMNIFLRAMATGYLDSIAQQMTAGKEDVDNWQSHRIKLITLSAFALGDEGLIERAHQAFMEQISVNISATGMAHDFIKRDALHYVVYDLDPLLVSALAAKEHGQDWFHAQAPSGAALPLALDWLTPFALGQKTHDEFVHSTIGFDAQRAHAGMKGYSGMWEPSSSLMLYQKATLLDPKYEAVFQRLSQNAESEHQPLDWLVVLAKAGL